LIAGLPPALWLGALFLVGFYVPIFTAQVTAAGPLLRRRGVSPAVLPPYLERAIPATALIGLSLSFTVAVTLMGQYVDVRPVLLWYLPVFGLLALALAGAVRAWPWPLRLLLHAAWLLYMGTLTVLF